MIAIIDNYDSFTYNLYQYIGEIDPDIEVFRNDAIGVEALKEKKPSHIIISPGPGFPENAGISENVIVELGKEIPILGICLGHQAIGEVFGGKIVHAEVLLHGKTSMISHDESNLFSGIASPLKVTRYHSLVVEKESLPEELVVTARGPAGEIMALQHKEYPIFGLQFHPESIATEEGKKILENFLKIEK
ncbi:anthranilate synthase component II [Clostridium formicaceticum]|uniref:Aminodeoxychorismate synthase component 2 n=1 Tax=Clostridium formicaceticum TaxID=1497 RepID=A0AAC9RG12_9CLOT|nr:aminodeoxychorismate/anthranilate synthase component II [Clostridium formicaceticum]AOY75807.1 aminodeoxychorismate/anthranilate synthase component II [Clostridium formicaceticum]ARE86136.1 Aminodeoxychorismate synthase component 2 [Clostridium formicaceticum]